MLDPQPILDALDPEQRRAAEALEGPVVVLAGAGTGKTRAMTHRIAYGVATGAFDPRGVLALTFTTRAAGEMRSRLGALGVGGVAARTFHSAALRQAQFFWPQAYGTPLPPVADSVIALVAEAARREKMPNETGLLRDLAQEISWSKVSNVAAADYADVAPSRGREVSGRRPDEVARVLARYEAVKQARGVIDFDDILLCNAALLAERPEIAHTVRRQYRWFVVDEYQDVSPLQQALLDLWRGDGEELCVVGDPAQTIHSFAGAQASFLTGFTRRHPRAEVVELVRDYRSTPQVVELANQVMRGHGGLELRAVPEPGPAPVFAEAASEPADADGLTAWLAGLHRAGVPWEEMAVLYRIHAMSPVVEAALGDADIPYFTRGAEGFFERGEVRTALRALQVAANQPDAELTPDAAFRAVLAGLGWVTEPPSGQGTARERWESWSALASLADDFVRAHPHADLAGLIDMFERRRQSGHAPAGRGVTLSTLHAAKGLEWEAVAVMGAAEGSLPFILATSPEQIEEERRLFYVGLTRARRHLRVSWALTRNGGGARRARTRFLDGIAGVPQAAQAVPRRKKTGRGTALAQTCRVCGKTLSAAAERKLGRHLDCPSSYDEGLFDALKAWRKATADAASVPAFVVFTDATLLAIAERTPVDASGLASISGIGPRKLALYGDEVLKVLADHG